MSRRRKAIRLSLVGAALGGWLGAMAPPAGATVVAPVTLAEMTARAELVVKGWVTDVEARRDPDGSGAATWVTLDGVEVLHGSHMGSVLELRFAGGEVDGQRDNIEGMPEFSIGERVLLFVAGNGTVLCPIVGWQQGVFRIVSDSRSGSEYLTDAEGNAVAGIDPGESVVYAAGDVAADPSDTGGVSDDAGASSAALPVQAVAPMSLAAFAANVDRLRGLPAPALATAHNKGGVPVDALNPQSRAPRAPLEGQNEPEAAEAEAVEEDQ